MAFGKKTEQKPEYVLGLDNTPVRNYDVYIMKPLEKMISFLAAFIVGALIGYLFYGGLAEDEFGNPTQTTYILDIVICGIVGTIAGKIFLKSRVESIINKRQSALRGQFRELLDTLAASIASGRNVHDAIIGAYDDMGIIYSQDDYIMQELMVIKRGMANSIAIEELLMDFGERSSIDDIKDFAGVFETCSKRGGNMKDIIRTTQQILSEKMNVKENIVTVLSSSALEQKIMLIMPILIVVILKTSDSGFSDNFKSSSGIVSTTIAVLCFIGSYYLSKAIMKIKV